MRPGTRVPRAEVSQLQLLVRGVAYRARTALVELEARFAADAAAEPFVLLARQVVEAAGAVDRACSEAKRLVAASGRRRKKR